MIARVSIAALLAMLALAAPAAAQETLHFEYGPVKIAPGQNTIEIEENAFKPPVDGWITGFRPNLVRRDGSVPRVDVIGLSAYPVFDAKRGTGGKDKQLTYPDEVPGAPRHAWTVPEDGAFVGTAGHLHPGGLWTDMTLTRDGRSTRLFRSKAVYYEPAGAVSWDVSMTATPPDWRVQLRKGDVISVSGTYDTKRASWYESMAIMPAMFDPGGTGVDPFTTLVDIEGFVYGQGDLSTPGKQGRPALVRQGKRLKFVNRDAKQTIYHTVTACKAPCTRETGIAYPLANGRVDFDSGELGFGPRGFTAAANRDSWKTPKGLKPGTYTYFCRVHPFMRGAFKVGKKKR